MAINLIIRDSLPKDVKELCLSMRQKDKEEAIGLGLDPDKAAWYANRFAVYRKTVLIDGDVAAVWGLHGTLLGSVGVPYLITNEIVHSISPIRFARIYKQEVDIMRELFPVLENYVDSSYKEAVRMLEIAGFSLVSHVTSKTGKIYYKFRIAS